MRVSSALILFVALALPLSAGTLPSPAFANNHYVSKTPPPPDKDDDPELPYCKPAITHVVNCRKPPKVAAEDQCRCEVRREKVNGRTVNVRDCYYVDRKTKRRLYCEEWRRKP